MTRVFRRPLTGLLTAVITLALSGDVAASVSASGRSTSSALTAAAPQRHVLTSPSPAGLADPASVSPAPATRAAGASAPEPKVTEKPPPVVDGVRRTNVGSAHSPQTLRLLSAAPATIAPPADAGALGVDVADYQHPHGAAINWPRVAAAGYKFAFIKATEGDYYANPYYAADLAQAKEAGLYATGYHFAVPNVSGGASQADYAVRNSDYTADGATLPLALDIEYNPYGAECYGLSATAMVSWLSAFTAEVRRLTGQLPVIYTTADWWHACTGNSTAFGADPLWVAGYVSGSPPMPAGWASWTFWQFTSHAAVPGITGRVDVSYFLSGAVRLLDPGSQHDAAGTAIRLPVRSLNAAGQPPHFTASGLPPGLSISGSGLITGTISPTASGTYGVTVTAASPSGGSGSVSFTWTVTSSQPSPQPSPSPSAVPSISPSPSASPSSGSPPPSPSLSPSSTPPAPSSPSSSGSPPAAPGSPVSSASPSSTG